MADSPVQHRLPDSGFARRQSANKDSRTFQSDYQFLTRHIPGLKDMMEPAEGSCFAQHRTGNDWKPKNCSHALVSIANVPQLSADESVWFYFKDKSSNTEGYIRAVRNKNFMGRWVTSLPGNVGATIEFKGLIVPIGHDPNKHGVDDGRIRWEFDGPNRSLETKTLAVTQIEKNYVWGDALGQTSDPF